MAQLSYAVKTAEGRGARSEVYAISKSLPVVLEKNKNKIKKKKKSGPESNP